MDKGGAKGVPRPHAGSDDQEGPAADSRQSHIWHVQTVGTSRMECMLAR